MQLKAFAEQHNPWRCRAYGVVSQPLNNGSFGFPAMTTIDFDPSGMVTTGIGGNVTIPVDGIYHVSVSGGLTAAADGTRFVVSIYKNGVEFKRGIDWVQGAANPITGTCNAIMYCKAGDLLKMAVFTATAAMFSVSASPYQFISVAYLCAA
jgi:hypothetical protein